MVLGEALLLVHLRLRLLHHPVEVLVVPVDEDIGRLEERHVDGLGIHRRVPPADQPDRAGLVHVHHVVQVVDELEGPQRGLDPGLGELARDRLPDLLVPHVAALRAVEDDLEAVREPGVGQELLALGQVLLDGLERRVEAEMQARQHGRHPHRLAVHHALDDLVGVDGVGQRLADALVRGRPRVRAGRLVGGVHLMRVDHELDRPDGRRGAEEELRVLLDDAAQVGWDVHRHVDLGVLERGHPHRVVGDRLEDHGLDLRGAVPVAREGLHHDLFVLGPADELEGPGADGSPRDRDRVLARVLLGRVHRGLAQGDVAQEHRPRLLGVDPHGVGIHDLHPVDRRERRGAPQLVGRVGQALDAELDRVGVEILAVVELDAPAQLELPGGRRHQLGHLGRERRHQLEGLVALDQALEHLRAHVRRRRLLLVHHVERGGVHALRDHDLARGGRPHAERDQDEGEEDNRRAPMAHVRGSFRGEVRVELRYCMGHRRGESRFLPAEGEVSRACPRC